MGQRGPPIPLEADCRAAEGQVSLIFWGSDKIPPLGMSAAVKSVVRSELELGVGLGPLDAERKRATDPAGPRVNSVLSGFPKRPWLLWPVSFSV